LPFIVDVDSWPISAHGSSPSWRLFSNTVSAQKKNGKPAKVRGLPTTASADDPMDLSGLEDEIASAMKRLDQDLSMLRTGGRFNPETLENLRVSLSKDRKKSARLRELAQVLPKGGRSMTIVVGDKEVRGLDSRAS
jgi:ribosome recycling factor